MAQPIGLLEGQSITHSVGRVVVVVRCVREGHAYRAAVHYGGSVGLLGAEIPELSQSWPTEPEARAAARRACLAFRDLPADLPFAVAIEQALESVRDQLDEAIARALGGGDGTGRQAVPLGRLTAAREALRTPAERIAEEELVERLRADIARYEGRAA